MPARFLSLLAAVLLLLAATSSVPAAETGGQAVSKVDAPVFRSPDGKATLRLLLPPPSPGAAYLGRGTFYPGASVPEHRHESSEELLYILAGRGTMILGEETMEVSPGMGIRIPAGVPHSFRVVGDRPVEVVQVYSPGGPEDRFREWGQVSPEAP